jgi:hypothetical protein
LSSCFNKQEATITARSIVFSNSSLDNFMD